LIKYQISSLEVKKEHK